MIFGPWTAAFVSRLAELGWIDGRTIALETRWSEGRPDRVAEITAEFVRLNVDVIVAYGGAVGTVKRATNSIPIVFPAAQEPLGMGLVSNLSHPGGNVTGLSTQSTETATKRLELIVKPCLICTVWPSCLTEDMSRQCGRKQRFSLPLKCLALKPLHTRLNE